MISIAMFQSATSTPSLRNRWKSFNPLDSKLQFWPNVFQPAIRESYVTPLDVSIRNAAGAEAVCYCTFQPT
jgi:hypothetical protein